MTQQTWREMSAARIEREYTPASRVDNIQLYLDEYSTTGTEARNSHVHTKLKYGPHDDEWMWLASRKKPASKLAVFVHGGFWRRLSADDGTFLTPNWHELGFDHASINYSLCPTEELAVLVEQVTRGLAYLRENYDPADTTLVGHSAGAHLVAMALARTDTPRYRQAILVSGIFDLEPITRTSVNDAVRLTLATARELSPLHRLESANDTPMTVIWGENETDEFKRQSREFVEKWSTTINHRPAVGREISSRNHFDILHDVPTPRVIDLADA